MARPSEYSFDLAKEVCARVSQGETIKSVLASKEEYPSFVTWCYWVDQNQELLNLYYASLRNKATAKEESLEEYIRELKAGNLDPHAAKVLIDVTKWQMATLNSKIYGAKNVNLDGDEVNGITINIHKKEGE